MSTNRRDRKSVETNPAPRAMPIIHDKAQKTGLMRKTYERLSPSRLQRANSKGCIPGVEYELQSVPSVSHQMLISTKEEMTKMEDVEIDGSFSSKVYKAMFDYFRI